MQPFETEFSLNGQNLEIKNQEHFAVSSIDILRSRGGYQEDGQSKSCEAIVYYRDGSSSAFFHLLSAKMALKIRKEPENFSVHLVSMKDDLGRIEHVPFLYENGSIATRTQGFHYS